jgi:3-oxoacyl-[acyl-carrier-protein] synthase-3
MDGRKIYEFALLHVPDALKKCLDNSGFSINQLNKIIIHQANEKMDEAIVKDFINCTISLSRKILCLWLFKN